MAAKKSAKEEFEHQKALLEEKLTAIREAEDDEAEKKAREEYDAVMKAYQKAADKYYNEKVTIRLFKDNGEYSDDVYVGWNMRSFLIKRGVDVEVPRGVAEIIRESEEQAQNASMYMDELSSNFETESKKRNI